MSIVAKVYDGAAPATLLGKLGGSLARQWRDALDDTGSFSLEIPARKDDGTISADAALAVPDRIVRFELDGVVRFAGIIGPFDRASIDEVEEPTQNIKLTGPGVLALLGDAVVFPELGVGRSSPPQRYFNFASSNFDHSGWGAAHQIKLQSDQTFPPPLAAGQWTQADGHSAPASWPDPTAYWIWGQAQPASGSPLQPIGDCYFWDTFTLAAAKDLKLFVTADDGFELYLDGALVAAQTKEFMWGTTQTADLFLDAGTHHVAIKGTNINRPSPTTNVAGVIGSIMEVTGGGSGVGAVVWNTSAAAKAVAYPAAAPTMTPGQILEVLIDEAHARGALPGITYDFSASLDSHGSAWTTPVDVSFPVQTSYLDVAKVLVGLAIDIRMDPATLVLSAFNKATMGSATGLSLLHGEHLTSLLHQVNPRVMTDVLIQYHTGVWAVRSTGGTPIKEQGLQLGGAPSIDQANRSADVVLADNAEKVHVTWGCRAGAGATPYVDFRPGDTVVLPDLSDAPVTTNVVALVISEPSPSADGVVDGRTLYAAEGTQ